MTLTALPELEPGWIYCPAYCEDGKAWIDCKECDESGIVIEAGEDTVCQKCKGDGQVQVTCSYCKGRGKMRVCETWIQNALRNVQRHHPGWNGSRVPQGVTQYALALWAIHREKIREKIFQIEMRVTEQTNFVLLKDDLGTTILLFTGFCWGYCGEGPHGLAALLSDLLPERFPTVQAALTEISSHPMNEDWSLHIE